MNEQTLPRDDAQWRALMLRAIASKCRKGMTDVRDADALEHIADQIEAPQDGNSFAS